MKPVRFLHLIFLLLISISAQPQNGSDKNQDFKEVLKQRYKGGQEAFLIQIYSTIKYPAKAMAACRLGQLNVEMIISASGKIDSIGFLNRLGESLEEEAKSVLLKTKGNWLPDEKSSL